MLKLIFTYWTNYLSGENPLLSDSYPI